MARHTTIVDVHLILRQGNRILLGLRQNTGFADGNFHLPAGHLEAGETIVRALLREAREELNISLRPECVALALVVHQKSGEGRLGLFFVSDSWEGALENIEPDKCRELRWFDLNALPENIVPYAKIALDEFAAGHNLALYGWHESED